MFCVDQYAIRKMVETFMPFVLQKKLILQLLLKSILVFWLKTTLEFYVKGKRGNNLILQIYSKTFARIKKKFLMPCAIKKTYIIYFLLKSTVWPKINIETDDTTFNLGVTSIKKNCSHKK